MPLSRWSSRHKKTFNKKKKEKWDGNFRLPPKPDSYYTQTKGNCRWCGKVILNEDGTINTDPWITHRTSFDGVLTDFESYTKPETGVIKAIIEVTA